jgi:hypothetical protein
LRTPSNGLPRKYYKLTNAGKVDAGSLAPALSAAGETDSHRGGKVRMTLPSRPSAERFLPGAWETARGMVARVVCRAMACAPCMRSAGQCFAGRQATGHGVLPGCISRCGLHQAAMPANKDATCVVAGIGRTVHLLSWRCIDCKLRSCAVVAGRACGANPVAASGQSRLRTDSEYGL